MITNRILEDVPSLSWINTVAVPGLTTLSVEIMLTWKDCVGSMILSSTTGITTFRVVKLSSPVLKVTVALVLDGKSSGETAVPFDKVKLKTNFFLYIIFGVIINK